MPEGLEAEIYRRAAAGAVGRVIDRVDVDDRQPAAAEMTIALPGRRVVAARRHGKVVVLVLDDVELGLHFGMTGRLIVDDRAAIDRLEYASAADAPQWDRLTLRFTDGGTLRVNDPRRWARFDLDPDLARLGPDVVRRALDGDRVGLRGDLRAALRGRRPVKAVLLDQARLAGFGNMSVDEVLFHAGVAPGAAADAVHDDRVAAVADAAVDHLPAMLRRGGSHTGVIDPATRAAVPPCPIDGEPLRRDVIGGRTTIWCPRHQLG